MKRFLAALAASLAFSMAAQAATVTLEFETADQSLPYQEHGFSVVSNDLDGTPGFPNGSSFFFEIEGSELTRRLLRRGEGANLARTNGGLFSLASFDFRAVHFQPRFFEIQSDVFEVFGFRNGVEVVSYGSFTTFSNTLQTIVTNNDTLIDSLSIVGFITIDAPTAWDNFVLETQVVPLPPGVPLLSTGLLVLVVLRRRRPR